MILQYEDYHESRSKILYYLFFVLKMKYFQLKKVIESGKRKPVVHLEIKIKKIVQLNKNSYI